MPTYEITADADEVNEGTLVTFSVATTEVDNGTTLYWTVAGTNVNASDFVSASTSGSITITGNAASFTTTVRNDSSLEGYEYYVVQLRTDSISGAVVAVSQNIAILDTSTGGVVNDPENGRLGCVSNESSKPAYYVNGAWYKVTGTAIPL
jgi:plastocyanin